MVVSIPCVESLVLGDLSGDEITNLDDFALFTACFEGPAIIASTPCGCAELNDDLQVDLADVALLFTLID
jgi:hypothetical protein